MSEPVERGSEEKLSYKFQRLRERLRESVGSGELSGKLPGERELAKRFGVNAKTLSKALTDLAAEGVLERSIGRGTYVKGSAPQGVESGRWLIVCQASQAGAAVVQELLKLNPETHLSTDVVSMRPSFINQFSSVVLLTANVPEAFVRDLCVRGVPVVAVDHEPRAVSIPAVLVDVESAAMTLGRDLLLGGHRQLVAVEGQGSRRISEALRRAAERWNPEASVDVCYADEAPNAAEQGATAFVCDGAEPAQQVRSRLTGRASPTGLPLAVAGVGCTAGEAPCTGHFVSVGRLAEAVVGMLRADRGKAPARLWLAGEFVNLGTTPVVPEYQAGETPGLRLSGVAV